MRYKRLLTSPESQSFFLFGPRGVGKSTWIRETYGNSPTFNLLDEKKYQSYLRDAGTFARELNVLPESSTVIIDEVQRLPTLLNEVHRFIEEKSFRFVLSGSSARKLRQSGVNLLAGRALKRLMFPLVPEELGPDFDMEAILQFGSLAVIWSQKDRREGLEAYVEMYLKEEIQAEALVRNLAGFARFLPIAALCHGQVFNTSNIARDAGVARTTVQSYLDILEDTLLTFKLPAYEAKLRVRERKSPKLYWIDPGLVRAVKRQLGPLSQEERGALFEGWIAALLYAYQSYRRLFDNWSYWSPSEVEQVEVDFLLEKDRSFLALEVKSAVTLHNSHLKGLRAISKLENLKARILVYRGDSMQKTDDGILIYPLEVFLDCLQNGTLWDLQ